MQTLVMLTAMTAATGLFGGGARTCTSGNCGGQVAHYAPAPARAHWAPQYAAPVAPAPATYSSHYYPPAAPAQPMYNSYYNAPTAPAQPMYNSYYNAPTAPAPATYSSHYYPPAAPAQPAYSYPSTSSCSGGTCYRR
jgi:hypothetical protein